MPRLELPTVTLCAVTSVNVAATIEAMRASLGQVAFADAILLTDAQIPSAPAGIRIVPVERLESARDYSRFVLRRLASHVATDHCLIVQWDGFVLDAAQWRPAFLDHDYIGARWPQFLDGFDVGNGGFSMRSARLLRACADPRFEAGHPEDIAICRTNRPLLEREFGIRFAPADEAERFSFERTTPSRPTFGFHGVFNVIPLLGADRFWEIYESLDDRRTISADVRRLLFQLGSGRQARRRRARLLIDQVRRAKRP